VKVVERRWHSDWLDLLEKLKRTDFWPMEPDAIGRVLEEHKKAQPSAARPVAKPVNPPSNLEVVKQLLRGASGARDFVEQAEKAGFRLVNHAPTHTMFAKGECKLVLGVFASQGPDTISFDRRTL
jgi:hypothetical protein